MMKDDSEKKLSTGVKSDLKPLTGVLADLRNQGFTTDFRFVKNRLIPFQYSHRSYQSSDIKILDSYRFEGDTDPADDSILYVIETNDGLKGTISNGHGVNADTALDDFLSQAENISEKLSH